MSSTNEFFRIGSSVFVGARFQRERKRSIFTSTLPFMTTNPSGNPSNFFPGVVRTVADLPPISRGEAKIFELVRDGEYAEALTASEIHLNGSAEMGIHENGDLLLFVREGNGRLTVAGEEFELSPDSAALIRDGEEWALSSTTPFKIFSVHTTRCSTLNFGTMKTKKIVSKL
ncbi:MAG: cupin domain-containing protein [Actinobacteria bacterium]|nr:cupin domain-containing protein [Actinomycetota bacterium]